MVIINKSVHVLIGKYLYGYVRETYGIYLDKASFLLGNVLPDLCLNFMIRPHVLSNYNSCIQRRIQCLLNIKQPSALFGKSYSKQLGIICHYYADYFCYPHRQDYKGDIVSHVRYEKDLHRYLQEEAIIPPDQTIRPKWQAEADERLLFSIMSRLQENYMKQEPSFENDMVYSISACTEALLLITRTSLIEQADKYELCYLA